MRNWLTFPLAIVVAASLGCTSDSGDDDDDNASELVAYCTDALANCTGADAIFASQSDCESEAAILPATGTTGATSGHTLQCRAYHAGAPAAGTPATHCPHASLDGDDTCGTRCEVYCQEAIDNCTGANELFVSTTACISACAAYLTTGSPGDTSGNTVQCRIYHLGVPAVGTPGTHCPHGGPSGGGVCI